MPRVSRLRSPRTSSGSRADTGHPRRRSVSIEEDSTVLTVAASAPESPSHSPKAHQPHRFSSSASPSSPTRGGGLAASGVGGTGAGTTGLSSSGGSGTTASRRSGRTFIRQQLSFDGGVPVLRMPPSRFRTKQQQPPPDGDAAAAPGRWGCRPRLAHLLLLPLLMLPLVLKVGLHLVALRAEAQKASLQQQQERPPQQPPPAAQLPRTGEFSGAVGPGSNAGGQAPAPGTVSAAAVAATAAAAELRQRRAAYFAEAAAKGPHRGRLNLLFIMSDQHRHDAMGHYFAAQSPQAAALTPNLNRLVEEGTLVANTFSYVPLCVPSRSAILTGSPPELTQVWRGTDEAVDPHVPTVAGVLQEQGYWTEFYGKWHNWEEGLARDYNASLMHRHASDLAAGAVQAVQKPGGKHLKATAVHSRTHAEFMERFFEYKAPTSAEMNHYHRFPTKMDKRSNDFPYTEVLDFSIPVDVDGFGEHKRVKNGSVLDFGNPGGKGVNGFVALPAWATESRLIANQTVLALRRIQREGRFPFSVTASFNKPHPPYIVSKCYFDKVWPLLHQLPLSRNVEANFEANKYPHTSRFGNKYAYYKSIANFFKNDPQRRRQLFALYLAGVMELDDNVGVILDALDGLGLTHSTLVVYTSDHGDMLGDHGMLGKQVLYEESVRVPLLLRLPGTITPGRVETKFANTLDIAPTILDFLVNSGAGGGEGAAALPVTRLMDRLLVGRSLRPLLLLSGASDTDAQRPGRAALFRSASVRPGEDGGDDGYAVAAEINAEHFMVRTPEWKAIIDVTRNESTALFHLLRDPHENVNLLAKGPQQALQRHRVEVDSLLGKLAAWREHVEAKQRVLATAPPTRA